MDVRAAEGAGMDEAAVGREGASVTAAQGPSVRCGSGDASALVLPTAAAATTAGRVDAKVIGNGGGEDTQMMPAQVVAHRLEAGKGAETAIGRMRPSMDPAGGGSGDDTREDSGEDRGKPSVDQASGCEKDSQDEAEDDEEDDYEAVRRRNIEANQRQVCPERDCTSTSWLCFLC